MLEALRARVEAEYPGSHPDAIDMALRFTARYVVGDPVAASDEEIAAAVSIAHVGYLFRKAEVEWLRLDSHPDVTAALLALRDDHPEWEDWFAAVAGAASTCAIGEDLAADATLQWAIPGVGAQARAMFAASTVEGMVSPGPAMSESDYRRSWFYGWYLRCFEDAMPPGASF